MSTSTSCGICTRRNVKTYKVEIDASAITDLNELSDFLAENMSEEGAWRYKEAMRHEIFSLAIFADLYRTSRYVDVKRYHPQARHMVSHNKRWTYIFHLEDNTVVIDRIIASKMITK